MKDKKLGGRPSNEWKVYKRAIPAPILAEVEAMIAKWKAEQKK